MAQGTESLKAGHCFSVVLWCVVFQACGSGHRVTEGRSLGQEEVHGFRGLWEDTRHCGPGSYRQGGGTQDAVLWHDGKYSIH